MSKSTHKALNANVKALAVGVINRTPDGSIGYDEAVGLIGEQWGDFALAGGDEPRLYEAVADFVRWAKWEGWCSRTPLAVRKPQ